MAEYQIDEAAIRSRVESRYNKRKELTIHAVVFVLVNVLLWALWGGLAATIREPFFMQAWPLLVTLGWGAGLAGHSAVVYYEAGRPAYALDDEVAEELLYGGESEGEIRRRLEQRLNKRKELVAHVAVQLPVALAVWLLGGILHTLLPGPVFEFPWAFIIVLGQAIAVSIHGMTVYFEAGGPARARDEAVRREIEREWGRVAGEDEKPKREPQYVLSDDGEIMELVDDELVEYKPKRGRRG